MVVVPLVVVCRTAMPDCFVTVGVVTAIGGGGVEIRASESPSINTVVPFVRRLLAVTFLIMYGLLATATDDSVVAVVDDAGLD